MPFSEETKVQIKKTLDLGDQLSRQVKEQFSAEDQIVVFLDYASLRSIENVVGTGLRVAILLKGTTDNMIKQSELYRKELSEHIQDKVWLYHFGDMEPHVAEKLLREAIEEEVNNMYQSPPWSKHQ